MTQQDLLSRIVEQEETVKPVLFKPVQFRVVKKLCRNSKLTETEKRYARGSIRKKMRALQSLAAIREEDSLAAFLNTVGSYYITGFEALKHNGFGWYYSTKRVDVMNTKIEGTVKADDKTINFIRVKSISKSEFVIENKTGIRFATNEQIFRDNKLIKNRYLQRVWIQMLNRYQNLFVTDTNRYNKYLHKRITQNMSQFGV